MNRLRSQLTVLILASMIGVGFGSVLPSFAANTVTTKPVPVPEEKAEEAIPEVQEPDESEVIEKTIPDEELPTLNPDSAARPDIDEPDPNAKPSQAGDAPEVSYDFSLLPEPVRRMRELILQAAKQGDIEKLRDLIGTGETATTLSLGGLEGDPIAFLKEASGDSEGYEVLAILIEVLEAGYVHVDVGTESEMYIWPYFFAWPLEKLTPPQLVELFRILTAGDVQDSQEFGAYVFYRVGIKPDGQWNFFVAGD